MKKLTRRDADLLIYAAGVLAAEGYEILAPAIELIASNISNMLTEKGE